MYDTIYDSMYHNNYNTMHHNVYHSMYHTIYSRRKCPPGQTDTKQEKGKGARKKGKMQCPAGARADVAETGAGTAGARCET